MHHKFCTLGGELEEAMRRAFYGRFRKNIKIREIIGIMAPSSLDGRTYEDLTFEQMALGPPEFSEWTLRNSPNWLLSKNSIEKQNLALAS